ncbi:unnamed protein product [Dicrocoelium dendriticum]|nr:unnamed protein product [Dicrocoelium dendriticum]
MQAPDFKVIVQSDNDDAAHSPQARQPLGLCILRPKPEPSVTYTSAPSPNGGTIGNFPDYAKNEQLDFKPQCTSERSFKTEEDAPVNSSDEHCAVRSMTAPSLSEQEQRPHKCEHCGKSFTSNRNKRRHLRTVHLIAVLQRHKCQYCEKSFPLMNVLRMHEQSVHLTQQPYTCWHCGKWFAKSCAMHRHLRVVHSGERAHTCEYCEKTFDQKKNLQFHIASIHFTFRSDTQRHSENESCSDHDQTAATGAL